MYIARKTIQTLYGGIEKIRIGGSDESGEDKVKGVPEYERGHNAGGLHKRIPLKLTTP
jgi:hypothetical protein